MARHGSSITALHDPVPTPLAEPCPRCGAKDWTNGVPASRGAWWCRPCWFNGHYDASGVSRRSALTRGEPMAGHVAFDPDNNDADREYLEHFRPIPTPRTERAAARFDDHWANVPTPQLLRRIHDGLCSRLMPGASPCPQNAVEFAGMSLVDIARVVLRRNGRNHVGGRGEIAGRALRLHGTRSAPQGYLTTGDFVDVLLSLARASLTAGYTVAPRTFTSWCRATTLSRRLRAPS
jgi:hypothetical protein